MKKQRPVNLALLTIRFPATAVASILHRASGVLVFLLIPFLLWALDRSLASPEGFNRLVANLDQPFLKFFAVGCDFGVDFSSACRHTPHFYGFGLGGL